MSRTNKIETVDNPASKLLKWKSSEGTFQYYNKNTEENVNIKLPFEFAIIEEKYVSFNGFDSENSTNIWSNEVKNANDKVVVKSGQNILAEFKKSDWKKVKDNSECKEVNYTQILYAVADLGEGNELIRIMLNKGSFHGSILKDKKTNVEFPGQEDDGWIRFLQNTTKKNSTNVIYDYHFKVTNTKTKKNGAVNFTIPVFELGSKVSDSDSQEYDNYSTIVDDYFINKSLSKAEVKEPILQDNDISDPDF